MTKKKYLVWPAYVKSKHDSDDHFVGFDDLCRLYRVDRAECIDARSIHRPSEVSHEYVNLRPDPSGRYARPDEK